MSTLAIGLILAFLFYASFVFLLVAVIMRLPESILGNPARAVLHWVPPFLGGKLLRDWAAGMAEEAAQKQLAGPRSGDIAGSLARLMEEGAMEAMLPLASPAERERVVACPETGQGRVGVTAPEALAIASYIRKNKTHAEQKRIYELALESSRKIAMRTAEDQSPHPCALQGKNHVCCAFAQRPLRCRPLHAIALAKQKRPADLSPAGSPVESPDAASESRHETIVAEGIEEGLTRALQSAGLDANVYELNSALAAALGIPDAAERWARGDDVFRYALR